MRAVGLDVGVKLPLKNKISSGTGIKIFYSARRRSQTVSRGGQGFKEET